jgi:hypothetical protein
MQKNDQPFEARTEYYKIEYLDEKSHVTEKELFDTVFAKLEKIQRQAILNRITQAEAQLCSLEDELAIFLAQK